MQQRPVVAHQWFDVAQASRFVGRGVPGAAERRAEQGPALQLFGQRRGRKLGVARAEGGDVRRGESLEAERCVDLATVGLE